MSLYPFLVAMHDLPIAGSPDRVRVAVERWLATVDEMGGQARAAAMTILEDARGSALISAIFGNSPFLTECWLANPGFAAELLAKGPDRTFAEILSGINDELAAAANVDIVMQRLRVAKARVALTVAVADIAGLWPLDRVTEALSDFAAASLDVAAGHLAAYRTVARGQTVTPPQCRDARAGLIILGMGKLGARELNYSSDIDIIILFDPDRAPPAIREAAEASSLGQIYTKLARDLVQILDARTQDGYVFRTDLRLRPDPGSTPLALSVRAAEIYYESVGQNWERAAMIKARAVAGDRVAGRAFLERLKPFVWRRSLDFSSIADIHSIKRQINAQRGGATVAVLGHDVKLGRGGIREIEFFAQTQQLIWGGRLPSLRVSGTCAALDALATADRITWASAKELKQAYVFLRTVEHRLQMIDDQQTHSVPNDWEGLRGLAAFMGYPAAELFEVELRAILTLVESHYAALFEEAPTLSGPGNLVFTGAEDDPATVATLQSLGFVDPTSVLTAVRGWHHGRIRATRSTRARELLTELMPDLLAAMAATAEPDQAFAGFDRFITNLSSGVGIFSLLYANPDLLRLVSWIMGTAPGLSQYLSFYPQLLDSVIATPLQADALPSRADRIADLGRVLGEARSIEDVLDSVRRWSAEARFAVGLAMLEGSITPSSGTEQLSDVAEAVIAQLLNRIEDSFAAIHGRIDDGSFVVIAYGRLGARELAPGSDLDLVFVYEAPEDVQSDGPKPLPSSLYYQRLAQRLISGLTAQTAEGPLYQIDMRLRPSGNKGPIASEFAGFLHYHEEEAWTWEQMAMTRARVVAGPEALSQRITRAMLALLSVNRPSARLIVDTDQMRRRITAERGRISPYDFKYRSGGQIDVEFITQYLILRHAGNHPGVISGNTVAALERLAVRELIAPEDADILIRAATLWSSLRALLHLTLVGPFDPTTAPQLLKSALAKACGAVDFAALERDITSTADSVAAIYRKLLSDPAERLGPPVVKPSTEPQE